MKQITSIAFAYFVDGKFMGWYGDAFGSLRKVPKLYRGFDIVKPIIAQSLFKKLEKINTSSFAEAENDPDQKYGLPYYDSEDVFRGRAVEVRGVVAPFEDRRNPNYDSSKPIHDELNPTWIYANRDEVRRWASSEPTEFVGVIKPNKDEKTI